MTSKSLVAGAAGVALAATLALPPAAPAATRTMKLFSQTVAERGYDATGAEVTDPAHEPVAGDAFVGVDRVFRGTHAKHSRKAIGADHVTCVLATVALPATLTGRCDAQIDLPGGMVFSDRASIELTADRATWPITGGTGRYAGVTGTLTSTNVRGGSDLRVKLGL